MLLHKLPTELTSAYLGERARPGLDFLAVRRISVWAWLAPVAVFETAMAIGAPASVLLASGHGGLLPWQVAGVSLASLGGWFMAAQSQQLYRLLQGAHAFRSGPVFATCSMWFIGVGILMMAVQPDLTIKAALLGLGGWLVAAMAVRLYACARLQACLRSGACIDRALVMAADRATARAAADQLETGAGGCIRAAACIPIPGTRGAPSLAWVEDAICSRMIDQVYIVGCDNLDMAFSDVLPQLAGLDIDVTLLSERSGNALAPICSSRVGRLYAVALSSRALGPVRTFAKRSMDLALGSLIMVILGAPALALIAIAIKLDSPGPVLFAQRREGLRGRVFRVLKFRTMFTHLSDEAARSQTVRNDGRVTPVGRILRRFSLDEIPQLINVLRGEMSIVGPRPHPLGMTVDGRSLHETIAEYRIRQRVKPGITGWAQINGCRGEVTTEGKLRQRIALDCEYIERCSVALDGWIILRTVATLLFDTHAY